MTDEHERAQAHDFPTENQLHHVGGENHAQHASREQCQSSKEVRITAVPAQIFKRVNLHKAGNERYDYQQSQRQTIDVLADAKMESPTLPPGPFMNHWLHIWSSVMCAFYDCLMSTINDAVHALNPLPCGSTRENK